MAKYNVVVFMSYYMCYTCIMKILSVRQYFFSKYYQALTLIVSVLELIFKKATPFMLISINSGTVSIKDTMEEEDGKNN